MTPWGAPKTIGMMDKIRVDIACVLGFDSGIIGGTEGGQISFVVDVKIVDMVLTFLPPLINRRVIKILYKEVNFSCRALRVWKCL